MQNSCSSSSMKFHLLTTMYGLVTADIPGNLKGFVSKRCASSFSFRRLGNKRSFQVGCVQQEEGGELLLLNDLQFESSHTFDWSYRGVAVIFQPDPDVRLLQFFTNESLCSCFSPYLQGGDKVK